MRELEVYYLIVLVLIFPLSISLGFTFYALVKVRNRKYHGYDIEDSAQPISDKAKQFLDGYQLDEGESIVYCVEAAKRTKRAEMVFVLAVGGISCVLGVLHAGVQIELIIYLDMFWLSIFVGAILSTVWVNALSLIYKTGRLVDCMGLIILSNTRVISIVETLDVLNHKFCSLTPITPNVKAYTLDTIENPRIINKRGENGDVELSKDEIVYNVPNAEHFIAQVMQQKNSNSNSNYLKV